MPVSRTLLYGTENWTMKAEYEPQLQQLKINS
jgi:hypothetical protein